MLQQAPPAPPPVLAPGQILIDGAPIANAADVYQAFRAQRRELTRQMDNLQNSRENVSNELQSGSVMGADRKGLEQRMTSIDERIASLDKQIAEADAQVAKAASIPGAAVDPPSPPRNGPPEEVFILSAMFMMIVLLPVSIAFARRIWRKSARIVTTIPAELSERLMRVEQTVESSAIEIERIGEGQRFMTRLFSEGQMPAAISAHIAQQQAALPAGKPGDVRP